MPVHERCATPKHPASLQSSIHHLPVRRVDCQLGCLDVWQKRHARTPSAPPNSALACPAVPAFASAAPLYAAIAAFSPAAWKSAQLGCTPALVLVRDAGGPAPPRPPPAWLLQHSPVRPAAPKTTPPAAQSAPISATKSPAPPLPHTTQSYGPFRRRKFCPGKPGRAA